METESIGLIWLGIVIFIILLFAYLSKINLNMDTESIGLIWLGIVIFIILLFAYLSSK